MIKAIVNHTGSYDGHFFTKGEEVLLPDHAVQALGEENIEVLEHIDEPKKGEVKEENKSIDEAKEDKQIKEAVVKK